MIAGLRVAAWSLALGALALLLVAPNANGPLIVLVWGGALGTFRYLASTTAGRAPRALLGVVFLWACFLGAFSGGWFLIPAGILFLMYDWRTDARGVDARYLRIEMFAAAASVVSGLIALALLVQTQPWAGTESRVNVGPEGTPIYEDLADLAIAGPPTDRLDLVVKLVGLLFGFLLLTAAAHSRTSSRLAFLGMCLSALGLATFAGLASLSAGLWFLPAVGFGIVSCLAAWRRRRRGPSATPTHTKAGRAAHGQGAGS